MKTPIVMKVALNTKISIESSIVYFRRFLHRFFWLGKQESINSNFNLTEEMFCNSYILLSYCIVADIFVAEHESASSNNISL